MARVMAACGPSGNRLFAADGQRETWHYQMMDDLLTRITVNPDQCGGRPCIRGMRIRVMDILDMLSGGMTQDEILADYDELEAADVAAALAYASRAVSHPVLAAE